MSQSRITTEKLPPIHPGDVLADTPREAGISATSAAIAMGLPPDSIEGRSGCSVPSETTVNVNPSDAALAPVTAVPDGKISETTTPGSLVETSKTLFPVFVELQRERQSHRT
jgi:hypothetical protein